MLVKKLNSIIIILLILLFCFPAIGQADPSLVKVYINGTLEYSPDPVYLTATALYSDGSTKDVTYSGTWESDNDSIATIYRGKVEFGNKIGNITITFSYEGFEDTVGTEVVDITELSITNSSISYSEEPVQLIVKGRYNNGSLTEITDHINYFSTNTDVATINSSGLITFHDEDGQTTIGVIFTSPLTEETLTDEITITVSEDDIDEDEDEDEDTEDKRSYTLEIDGELDPESTASSLKAYKLFLDDSKKTLSNELVKWTSSNSFIAEVDEDGKVTFTGKPGSVTITASYNNKVASISTTVATKLESLKINESLNFTPNYLKYPPKLTVTGKYNSGKEQLVYNSIWSSSNEAIASINENGQITFTGSPGEVTFSAEKEGLTASISCTIPQSSAKTLQDIFIEENLFYSTEPQTLKAFAIFTNGSEEEITNNCQWTSSNESVATIENETVYFSGFPGIVEISCSYEGFTDTVKTQVSVPSKTLQLNEIKFLDHYLTYNDNGKSPVVFGIYSDNSKKVLSNVLFYSFQPNIVKILNDTIRFTGNPGNFMLEASSGGYRATLNGEIIKNSGKNIPIYIKIVGNLDTFSKTVNLQAYAVYSDNKEIDITQKCIWNTSNNNIATISDKGKIDIIGNGPVRISAYYDDQTGYLSNKAYYQFGSINPLKESLVNIARIKEHVQTRISSSTSLTLPSDVNGHWAQNDIQLARRLGWMGGYPDGSMKPDNIISRGEFASLIERALHLSCEQYSINYLDTTDHWAKESIRIIANLGICPIDTSRKFRPNDPLTREEMAEMLANLINIRADNYYPYLDVSPDYKYATAIAHVTRAGIVSGMEANYFKPKETATRAQALAVLLRLLKTDPELEGLLSLLK